MQKDHKPEYLTTPRLKERGWTDSMIKKFLGEPDATRDNPHYKSAAPMKLYETKRVERVERRKSFKEYMEASVGRKASAQKGVKTKLERTLEYARSVIINVPVMDYEKVVRLACNSYNEFHEYLWMERGHEYTPADHQHSDPDFLSRITMNYLRHECSSYEQQLYKLFGKTGVHEAHDILQRRINEEIKRIYPRLKQ